MSTPNNQSNTNESSFFIPAIIKKGAQSSLFQEPKEENDAQIGNKDNENETNKGKSQEKIIAEPKKKSEGKYTYTISPNSDLKYVFI